MSDELLEINRALGNIEGKLDTLQGSFDAYVLRHDKLHAKLDREMDAIKADVNKAKGASSVIGMIAGGVGAAFALVVNRFFGDG